jgi:hypothetical protein
MSGSPGWSPPAPHHRTRDDVPFSQPPSWSGSPLRSWTPMGCWSASSAGRGRGSGGSCPSGRTAGSARPPGRGGRGGDRGERPPGVGPTKTSERRTVPLPRFLAEQLGTYLANRRIALATCCRHARRRAAAGLQVGERSFRPAVAAAGLGDGHLYPSDLDALAERLDRAQAAAATELWPQGAPRCRQAKRKARSVTWPVGGGGETRTPVPRRRSRASPSAASG